MPPQARSKKSQALSKTSPLPCFFSKRVRGGFATAQTRSAEFAPLPVFSGPFELPSSKGFLFRRRAPKKSAQRRLAEKIQWYNENYMNETLANIWRQIVPILISGILAAALAFAQSVAAHSGFCPNTVAQTADVGVLGGMIKAGHSLVRIVFKGIA